MFSVPTRRPKGGNTTIGARRARETHRGGAPEPPKRPRLCWPRGSGRGDKAGPAGLGRPLPPGEGRGSPGGSRGVGKKRRRPTPETPYHPKDKQRRRSLWTLRGLARWCPAWSNKNLTHRADRARCAARDASFLRNCARMIPCVARGCKGDVSCLRSCARRARCVARACGRRNHPTPRHRPRPQARRPPGPSGQALAPGPRPTPHAGDDPERKMRISKTNYELKNRGGLKN